MRLEVGQAMSPGDFVGIDPSTGKACKLRRGHTTHAGHMISHVQPGDTITPIGSAGAWAKLTSPISTEINDVRSRARDVLRKELEDRAYQAEQTGKWCREQATKPRMTQAARDRSLDRADSFTATAQALREACKALV